MVLSKVAKNFLEGRFACVTMFFLSLSKREVTEVFQVSIDKPRNTGKRGKKNYCDYLEQGL